MSRYQWILVALLAGFWGLVGLNRLGLQFLAPFIIKDLHLSLTQFSLLVSGTSIARAVSAWVSGSVSDRIGRKRVLLVGMYAASCFPALFGLAWNSSRCS